MPSSEARLMVGCSPPGWFPSSSSSGGPIGNAASGVRQSYDEMSPKETDSTEVRVAKEVFRWSSAVAGAAAAAVVVL